MYKRAYRFILICTFIIIGNVQPVYAEDDGIIDVIIGYENEEGKSFIHEHSHEVNHGFQHISALSVSVDKEDIPLLEENPNVAYIKENSIVELSNNEQIREVSLQEGQLETEYWNIDLIGAKYAWLEGFTGKGVKIAVIDTGIAPHSELAISGGISTVDYTDSWTDDHGHGTHVAGVIAGKKDDQGIVGVAPDAQVYAAKALDQNGEGNIDDVLQAMDWAITNGMDIINLSLGMKEADPLLEEMINKAYQSGILVVGASGNKGETNSVLYPARYENVIAVSAVDARLNLAPFSSTGNPVEFSAPGIQIISTFLGGSYGVANGTSQAAPHVVGMLALLQEKYPGKNHVELRQELTQYVQDIGATGRDALYGHGFITYFPDDRTPPGEVENVELDEVTSESISLRWKNPTDEDLEIVEMYLDDEFVHEFPAEAESTYLIENLSPNQSYDLTFYTIDHFGNRSEGMIEMVMTMDTLVENDETEKDQVLEDQALETKKEETDKQTNSSSIAKDNDSIEIVEKQGMAQQHPIEKVEWSAEVIYPETEVEEETMERTDISEEEINEEQEVVEETEQVQEEELTTSSKEWTESEEIVDDAVTGEAEKQESQQEEKGFFGKIIDSIVGFFVTFFTWLRDLFR